MKAQLSQSYFQIPGDIYANITTLYFADLEHDFSGNRGLFNVDAGVKPVLWCCRVYNTENTDMEVSGVGTC